MGWIDINDQMPTPNVYVLINGREGVTIGKWDGRPPSWGYVSQPDEPLAHCWHNMQTDLLNLDDSERSSFSIKMRVTHWMPLPERPNVEYRIPREWTAQEQQAWHKKQMDNIMEKYSDKNYDLMVEMLSKTTMPQQNPNIL